MYGHVVKREAKCSLACHSPPPIYGHKKGSFALWLKPSGTTLCHMPIPKVWKMKWNRHKKWRVFRVPVISTTSCEMVMCILDVNELSHWWCGEVKRENFVISYCHKILNLQSRREDIFYSREDRKEYSVGCTLTAFFTFSNGRRSVRGKTNEVVYSVGIELLK